MVLFLKECTFYLGCYVHINTGRWNIVGLHEEEAFSRFLQIMSSQYSAKDLISYDQTPLIVDISHNFNVSE